MRRILISLFLLALIGFGVYRFFFAKERFISVLVFTKTEGFVHESIDAGKTAVLELGKKHGFPVDTTSDASFFNEKTLQKYNVVIFMNTTGDVLNDAQQLEFNRFIQAGGGFVGVHAAADTEYDWPWYGDLVGAYFESHPNDPNVRDASVQVIDAEHTACKHLPNPWNRTDEWYNYKEIRPFINTILNLDETSYEGGTNGEKHPISWYHEFDGGRSFYTGMGHTIEAFQEPAFVEHLWGGISYAAGEGLPVDYNRSTVAPEENRFQKTVLAANLNEPMELAMLPNRKIIFIERGGAIKLYEPAIDSAVTIHQMEVFSQLEDGLLGMALDPDFENNRWIYFFYSPPGEEAKQHVSRIKFGEDERLDMSTEQVLLVIPTQREECCHSAGSLEFGPDGNLFISTGDNTNPHASDGYSPSDEREGRGPWDAQKSSANTNDLRGKILRIKPETDGSYSIPAGNLFPSDGSKGRPEIYVMGCRNPYRISIDPHTGYLYWGEVGPDAGEDSLGRGPMGYDEVNQAKSPGFYGWPYFIGDNKPYNKYNFATQVSLEPFDLEKPINVSPNNTGAQELPPAQNAFIWYPYGASKEFPLVGQGGRNAMAGPVFYHADFPENEKRYPEYYDGKLFTYDWMRGWIMAVTMNEEGQFERMERFLPSFEFNNPIDMILGPDGDIWLLEYGTIWFSDNPDARLVHLEYISGNRPPVAAIEVAKTIGAAPLALQFKGETSKDFDGDDLQYEWIFEGEAVGSTEANPTYTFNKAGEYKVQLKVTDPSGEIGSTDMNILVGNEPPQISWDIQGNKSFFFDNSEISYSIAVQDAEDGSLNKGITADQVNVSIDFLERGFDQNEIAMGHKAMQEASRFLLGKRLMEQSDCKTCHQEATKSVGPSYVDVAQKYKDDPNAISYLSKRIIKGGGGVWGEIAMAAHPQLTESETNKMVEYILSLSGEAMPNKSLPISGSYALNKHKPSAIEGSYILTASYTDKGGEAIGSLTARDIYTLRSPMVGAATYDAIIGAQKFELKAGQAPGVEEDVDLVIGAADGYIVFNAIDLTGIQSVEMGVGMAATFFGGGKIEYRLDAPDGPVAATVEVKQGLTDFGMQTKFATFDNAEGVHDLYITFIAEADSDNKPVCALIYMKYSDKRQNM